MNVFLVVLVSSGWFIFLLSLVRSISKGSLQPKLKNKNGGITGTGGWVRKLGRFIRWNRVMDGVLWAFALFHESGRAFAVICFVDFSNTFSTRSLPSLRCPIIC